MGKGGRAKSARGQGQLMQVPEDSGRSWKATLRHLQSILQAWGGMQRKKRSQIWVSE